MNVEPRPQRTWRLGRPLAGHASIYLGGNIANAAIPFLLLPWLTRVLSPTDYGAVAMFGIMVSVLAAFTGLNVHGALSVRFVQLDTAHLARYVGACLRILVVSSLLVAIAVTATGSWLQEYTQIPAPWLLIAVVMASAQMATNVRLTLWQMDRKAGHYVLFQVGLALTNAVLSVVLVLLLQMQWHGRVLGQTLAVVAFAVLALISLRGGEVAPPAGTEDTRDALRFGVPLIPHVLGGLLIATTDRVMVANLLDLGQAGIYSVALQLGMVMALLTESFNKAYAPWLMTTLVHADANDDKRIVRGTYLYFVVVFAVAIALGLLGPMLLSVLVGEQFRNAADAVLYIAMGFAFGGMYYMVTGFVFFASKTAYLAAVTLASGVINVLVTWLLIRANGVVGAAQGFMISQAVLFVATWWLAQRARPMPWRRALFALNT